MTIRVALPVILTLFYTVCLLTAGNLSKKLGGSVTGNSYINDQFNYQLLLLALTAISILITYFLNKQNFLNYFSFGQISAVSQELRLFGIRRGDTWAKTGLSLCVVISAVTATFMYLQTKPNWGILQNGIIWIILFSLTNSFGEEMIYRLGIVSPLKGLFEPTTIFFISAILFGLPHFRGMPDGVIGATMAGVLGFVLAKSMYETNGFFWAWLIHFLQDLIIFGTLYMMSNIRH